MKTKILPLRLVVALASVCLFALALCFDAAPRGQTKDSAHSAQHTALPAARRALVVSLDGLDARYLLRADEYGLKIPTLRRLMAEGLRAEGVIGVYPSVTYPSHTTIVTGARPARHGVYANELFEPPPMWQLRRWYWSASYVRAETLWDAAARAGLKTGVVSWPVSTGAGDWSVPEIWKVGTNPYEALEATLAEISANARPRGIVEEIAARDKSVYANGTNDERDDMRTRWAEYVIAEKRPHMVLVHLFDLDHFQHKWGPFTPEAFGALEKSDAYVARLLAAHERAGTLRETAVFVVSDHGFLPITKQINPNVLLARAGLIKLSEERDARGGAREVIT